MAAALEAQQYGFDVTILEKTNKEQSGGNTRLAGGTIAVPAGQGEEAAKEYYDDVAKKSQGRGNAALLSVLARNVLADVEWLKGLGVELLPPRPVKELISLARSRPGALNFASAGNGSSGHLTAELFKSMAAIPVTHIPYKGAGPALVDVLAGQVHYMFANILSSLPYVKSGRVKGLAVTSARRSPNVPEIPTVDEGGVKGYQVTSWYGVLAPAGTPQPVIDKLSTDINAVMKSSEMQAWLARDGAVAVEATPDQFAQHIATEIARWRKVVKDARIQAE